MFVMSTRGTLSDTIRFPPTPGVPPAEGLAQSRSAGALSLWSETVRMRLVGIFTSRTAAELEAIVTVLEARAVPCFARDIAIASRNNPGYLRQRTVSTILVPAEHVSTAVALIGAPQRANRSLEQSAVVRLGRAIRAAFPLHRPAGCRRGVADPEYDRAAPRHAAQNLYVAVTPRVRGT
jgi:hypothetical protein